MAPLRAMVTVASMSDNRHPKFGTDNTHFVNALRAWLGLNPLYQNGRSKRTGYDRGDGGHSDIGLRWMAGLTADSGGRVLPHRPR